MEAIAKLFALHANAKNEKVAFQVDLPENVYILG